MVYSLVESVPMPASGAATGSVSLEEQSCGKGCTEKVDVDDDAKNVEVIVTGDDDRGVEKEVPSVPSAAALLRSCGSSPRPFTDKLQRRPN